MSGHFPFSDGCIVVYNTFDYSCFVFYITAIITLLLGSEGYLSRRADRGKLINISELFFPIFRQQIATVEIDEF
jgi:hypothetical protein